MGLYVAESGPSDGPAVLFLHGAVASGSRMWQPQLHELSADLRCMAVDLPGHASSSSRAWESLDRAADDVADVIRTMAAGRAAVVGLAVGGYVALRLALRQPQLLSCTIISGVSIVPVSLGAGIWRRWQLAARYSGLSAPRSSQVRAGVSGAAAGAGSNVGPPPPPTMRPVSRPTVKKIAGDLARFWLPASKRRSEGTVLVVAGEHESRPVLRSLRPLADHFTAGVAKYAPDAGHDWNVERPELFNAMVRSWVIEQRLPPRLRDPEQWTD